MLDVDTTPQSYSWYLNGRQVFQFGFDEHGGWTMATGMGLGHGVAAEVELGPLRLAIETRYVPAAYDGRDWRPHFIHRSLVVGWSRS